MENFRVATKAFIVKDGKLLVIRRRADDPHKPNEWDIPGGRLELGEDPFEGVQRETKEEVGLAIEVLMPLEISHFTRDDGQKITMIIFLCKPLSNSIRLSKEHTEYKWTDVKNAPQWLRPTVENFVRYIR